MRVANPQNVNTREQLSLKQLRTIERDLDIYLNQPVRILRTMNEQFGVYDEDEYYAGDVVANERYFTQAELREKIMALFKR